MRNKHVIPLTKINISNEYVSQSSTTKETEKSCYSRNPLRDY